ncbi:O-methyltransferase [Marinicrinis sediminis]|uniref:O-methyltransferase n=1 Tax=Marinicrinis sediminis TaxID=1652465 RepID=A0ABW5R7G6_9BACL
MKDTANISLAKQIECVFWEISQELLHLSSGLIFIHIRNNIVGKFGVKHDPIESVNGKWEGTEKGLTAKQINAFREMAVESLAYKHWTHGEIQFEFALKKDLLYTSVTFESNYNMANRLKDQS